MTFRTTKWIGSACVAVAAGFLAFAVARHSACRTTGMEPERLRDITFLRRELRLSKPQAERIGELNAELAERLAGECVRHCSARMLLGQALGSETDGDARTESALAEMCRAYEASERTTWNHIRAVRALLDGKQRKRFDHLLAECLCRSCPSCGTPCHDAKPDEERH